MPVPWDPLFKAKWKEFIVASAARYDNNPQLQYLVMAGFQQTGECYLASAPKKTMISSTPVQWQLGIRRRNFCRLAWWRGRRRSKRWLLNT